MVVAGVIADVWLWLAERSRKQGEQSDSVLRLAQRLTCYDGDYVVRFSEFILQKSER